MTRRLYLMQREIGSIYRFERRTWLRRPVATARVCAGFPSPAADWAHERLDLNELLVDHPVATHFTWVEGDSMTNFGILPGDLVVIDRAAETRDGDIIVAVVDSELCIRKLRLDAGALWLESGNDKYPPIEITEGREFFVWGKVTHAIHSLK